MFVAVALRSDPGKEPLEVAPGCWRRILLDQQRRGGVPDEQGQQSLAKALPAKPGLNVPGYLVQPGPKRGDREGAGGLTHAQAATRQQKSAPVFRRTRLSRCPAEPGRQLMA